jgi:hypothetical protein
MLLSVKKSTAILAKKWHKKEPRNAASVYCIPQYSFFKKCSPNHINPKTDQQIPGDSFILMIPASLLTPPLHDLLSQYFILNLLYKKSFLIEN